MRSARSFLILLLLICPTLVAAGVKTPSWKSELNAPVRWQHMTMFGTLIVNTNLGLVGIDATSGKRLWAHKSLATVVADNAEEIPATPLVVLDDGADDARIVIVNVVDGTIVFDSKREGLVQILDKRVLPRSGGLLIAGFEAGKPQTTLFMYDMATGTRRWRSDALHSGTGKLMTFLTAVIEVTQNISPLSSGPLELDDGSFLLAASGKIYRMRADNGAVMWKQSFGWGYPELYLNDAHPERVFVGAQSGGEEYMEGTQSVYHSLALDTGEPIWKKPAQFRGAFNPHLVFATAGLVISEHTEGGGRMRMLDYHSGDSLWGKKGRGLKIKGGIVDHAFVNNQLVITTGFDSAWNDKGTEYLMYVVDLDQGALRTKKPTSVRGRLRYTSALPSGLLYVTSHEVNVLEPATGKLLNNTAVRSKRPIVATRDADTLYAFTTDDGLVHKLDLSSGRLTPFSTAKVKLQGKDTLAGLEVRPDGLVLLGQQSLVAWDRSGTVVFESYHPAPKRNAFLQALLYAQAARSAAASFASGAYAVGFADASNNTNPGTVGREITTGFAEGYADMSEGYAGLAMDYFKAARSRFQASAAARDFVFMMVRQDNRRIGLAQVSKDSGAIVSVIDLGRETKPNYQVDDIGNQIFHQTDPSVIVAYQF
ncbi:MAG: PQQ-like beta-propeller repeat protein [Gammaproteobacteria bacterium]|nr:PQQ-like beta-propeller repeat protein [Gammaproteobacteria bacterium]